MNTVMLVAPLSVLEWTNKAKWLKKYIARKYPEDIERIEDIKEASIEPQLRVGFTNVALQTTYEGERLSCFDEMEVRGVATSA
jgi:hypothetical protein